MFIRFSQLIAAVGLAAALLSPGIAEVAKSSIRVVDMTPQFLAFYEKAVSEPDPARRFELWKEHYGFIALPPGLPDRDERARALLDVAWPDYAALMETLEAGAYSLSPQPGALLEQVAKLLGIGDAVPPIILLYYVGMFEGNAFFAAQPDGSLVVGLPAEMSQEHREVVMAHELAHALHHSMTGLAVGPEGSVADLVISEGIAMHTTRAIFAEQPDHVHVAGSRDWLTGCDEQVVEILQALSSSLDAQGPEAVNRMTVGLGFTGMEREGYCAGWHLVGHLLDNGSTLADLVRMSEREVIAALLQAINDFKPNPRH
ncbi:MAG: hypothetical protein JJU27_18170 [Gammaproteobacteria bacterium]|nr:hypothetical protein [Gammaproteobacteria bacterium]